jgi:dUTP pyrophosphatase
MKVKIKKLHKDSVLPSYAKYGDAGMDLTAVSKSVDYDGNSVYGIGLAFEIPFGYVGYIFPRSSNSKTNLRLTNSVGVIDSGYRGEVMVKFRNDNFANCNYTLKNDIVMGTLGLPKEYDIGDRVAQLIIMPIPTIEFEEVNELNETERGTNGYGSTGN